MNHLKAGFCSVVGEVDKNGEPVSKAARAKSAPSSVVGKGRPVKLAKPTRDQAEYLERVQKASTEPLPDVLIGGPKKRSMIEMAARAKKPDHYREYQREYQKKRRAALKALRDKRPT